MSLATERERAVVWSGGKCTRQSLLDLNVNTQPLPVLPLKVTLVTLEHCTDRAVFLVTGCCSTLQVVNKLHYNVQEVLLKFCISERKTSESVSTPKSRSECKFEPVVSF